MNKQPISEQSHTPVSVTNMFTDFGFDSRIESVLARRGFSQPTPIQDQTIPHTLLGRDVIGLANTGTGKTAAFLLPLIQRSLENPQHSSLILTPTRELAQQIHDELRLFTPGMSIYSTVCVGGTSIRPQIRNLGRHQHFIIATPGRLIDLMKQGAFSPESLSAVVLDEADRMLDMGFVHDMRYIISRSPSDRTTLFFSATMSRDVMNLTNEFLTDPVTVSLTIKNTGKNIEQDIVRIDGRDKVDVLKGLLKKDEFEKVIVFGRTKRSVDHLSKTLYRDGFQAESIHGDKSQRHRERSLRKFTNGQAKVLVATDVAARGIDVPSVSHVINFDIPATYDDYIHRIGRTGRGGASGKALTFVD